MKNYYQQFYGQTTLITGGSSGIGFALAQQLAYAGANVWLLARSKDKLERALAELPISAQQSHGILVGDVADWQQVYQLIQQMKQKVGLADLIINSAGITHPGYIQDLSIDIFQKMISVNYLGTVNVIKAALPDLMTRGKGTIVNISSVAGFIGVFGYSAYGASKYAVRGFSDVLRAELKPLGIHVSVVFPPDTDTPQLAYETPFKPPETRALSSTGGVLTANQVAQAILKGIIRRQYVILPGAETKLLYYANNLLGNAIYPLMDWMISRARP